MTDYVHALVLEKSHAASDARVPLPVGLAFVLTEARRLLDDFATKAVVDAEGIVRWRSNGAVPPRDITELWAFVGKPFNHARSADARRVEMAALIQREREAAAARTPEENEERRAMAQGAHGPGVTLVNVFTGERFVT